MDPGDIVPDGPHAIPGELGHDHGEIGLARGARHGRGEIGHLAVRILESEDQHVLGHPAFLARLRRRDAERVTLLAEERVAPVPGADAPDEPLLGEVHDEAPVR